MPRQVTLPVTQLQPGDRIVQWDGPPHRIVTVNLRGDYVEWTAEDETGLTYMGSLGKLASLDVEVADPEVAALRDERDSLVDQLDMYAEPSVTDVNRVVGY